jgi:predicted ferric reductase
VPLRRVVGTRADWRLVRPPRPGPFTPGARWVGPIVVVATLVATWPAFAGTAGEDGDVSFALYIGSISIGAMAWSFVLAVRTRWLEPWFGGLDRMYRVHRWLGAASVGAMFLHVQTVDELERGIPGASRDLAKTAEDLAGLGETMLYVLVAISVVRLVPTRWWRWTHKLLVVPYAFACFHFFTAEKPYANGSAWGWWFAVVMVAGLAAWFARVVWRDMVRRGTAYRIVSTSQQGSTVELMLEPSGSRRLRHRVGQFAFVKLQVAGMSEPHPFTIASHPDEPQLRFVVRALGDWSDRLPTLELQGAEVVVEGPYGRFRPAPRTPTTTVWIAGGVGITPFLGALRGPRPSGHPVPHLVYQVRSRDDAPALAELEQAHRDGRVELHLYVSSEGDRIGPDTLRELFGAEGLRGAHVAVCGPAGLVRTMSATAHDTGAHVEHEDFDIRSGVGPDLSRELDQVVAELTRR